MYETPLVWIEPKIAVPPKVQGHLSSFVLITNGISYCKSFYDHKLNEWKIINDEGIVVVLRVCTIKYWAKVILPKSKEYNELSFEFINNN